MAGWLLAAKPARDIDDLTHQQFLVVLHPQLATLGRSGLPEHPAGTALGDAKLVSHVRDGLAPPLRAQKFPEAVSRRMALSRAWSATKRFRRVFSRSSSRRRFA